VRDWLEFGGTLACAVVLAGVIGGLSTPRHFLYYFAWNAAIWGSALVGGAAFAVAGAFLLPRNSNNLFAAAAVYFLFGGTGLLVGGWTSVRLLGGH